MAKKESKSASDLLGKLLEKHDPKGSIIDQYTPIDDSNLMFINTGNYMVNAHFSGSILKGAPVGKFNTICGDPKAGKSYVLLNIAREAQLAGYYVIYIETEFSHDKNRFELQGIDTTNARITQPTTVEALISIVSPLVHEFMKIYDAAVALKDEDKKKEMLATIPKIAFFLDSRSGLLSKQQLDSFAAGEPKANMGTDIQAYDNFMKSIAVNIGKLGWGFFVASHTKIEEVKSQGRAYTKRRPKGGFGQVFMSSVISMMWKKDERDDEDKSKIIGINVTMDIFESRYVKHRPISFFLPNDRPMNPLDGLMEYVTWEACQIGKGKWVDVLDIRSKLIAKKVITADDMVITDKHLSALSKADSEYIGDILSWLSAHGYIKNIEKNWAITEKYLKWAPTTAGAPIGMVAIESPNSPKFICAHLPGEFFTYDELLEDKGNKIFTKEVLEKIDVYVRADFEIGAKSKNDGEKDYFGNPVD